jgi:hypothetical protein
MKSIFTFIFVLLSMTEISSAQNFLGKDIKKIKKEFQKIKDTAYTFTFSDSIINIWDYTAGKDTATQYDTIANLKVMLDGFEKMELDYFFEEFDGWCDSMVIKYYCGICAEHHINEMLKYEWKKIGEDKYISTYWVMEYISKDKIFACPTVHIVRTPDQPICTTLYYSVAWKTRDEMKAIRRK